MASSGTPGINHETQVLADVIVAADGTTTVGHYKLGKKSLFHNLSFQYAIL